MDTLLRLISKAVTPTDRAQRLFNDYDKGARLCRLPACSPDFRLRRMLTSVALFFCVAQGIVTQVYAQAANLQAVAITPGTTHTPATVPFASSLFSRTVLSAKPPLVITLVEDKSISSIPRITTASELAIDRSSTITTPDSSQIISARESVMRYKRNDHIAATQIADSSIATVLYQSIAFDGSGSEHNRSPRLEQRYLPSWPERVNVGQGDAIKQLDRSLSIDERPRNVEPLMIVGIGRGSLPISLYMPAFR